LANKTILLTGASGFIGRHTAIGLLAAGYTVRAISRTPEAAHQKLPWINFVRCELASEADIRSVITGCDGAVYLYHGLQTGHAYDELEAHTALKFRRIADEVGLRRIVYLGGVEPQGRPSKHLLSRLRTGAILRDGTVSTLELRAAMVIGHESQSFSLIRDLVTTMPVLALPNWLDQKSCPIAIDDVVSAITLAIELPESQSKWFDLPGPECLSHRALLAKLCHLMRTPLLARRIPLFSPRYAAIALSVLSRVPSHVSRELVQGLTADLTPQGTSFWQTLSSAPRRSLVDAIIDAFADEYAKESPSVDTRRRITEDIKHRLNVTGALSV
jgi:uncharacterized protein YbjT (DUF2867 family)